MGEIYERAIGATYRWVVSLGESIKKCGQSICKLRQQRQRDKQNKKVATKKNMMHLKIIHINKINNCKFLAKCVIITAQLKTTLCYRLYKLIVRILHSFQLIDTCQCCKTANYATG